ncbi:MAG TPA: hypothetical protein HPP76_01445 [Desulfuromonadales bacterium]|nr:hypothetical protein [Desulfuromonadales bacterium]
MKPAMSAIDASILPNQACQELHDFYSFLVGKYVKRPATKSLTTFGTAGALAASPLVGMWKDRDLGNSSDFARSLRDQAR